MAPPEDLNLSLIANCVLNAFLSCTAIMLNIITILALRKTSSLPALLKTLLLSLAVSDLGVGLLVQPLYIARLVMMMEQNNETQSDNITRDAYNIAATFLGFASYFCIVALSADRFLAIHLHLRYRELVTRKRVVALVISVWVFSAILPLLLRFMRFSWIPKNITIIAIQTITSLCNLTTAFFYFKIYLSVRHHSNQIHVLQAQLAQNREVIANAARQRKSAIGTFYVFIVFLACYLPTTCYWIVVGSTGRNAVAWQFFTFTLIYLNSSLNPLIYCWKMRLIRHAVMDILRNILPSHN